MRSGIPAVVACAAAAAVLVASVRSISDRRSVRKEDSVEVSSGYAGTPLKQGSASREATAIVDSEILSITDAVSDGSGWYVLDRQVGAVHRLDSNGSRVFTFGSRGEGPGEFRAPSALLLSGDTTIVVESTGTLHLFDAEGRFLDDLRIPGLACAGTGVDDLFSSSEGWIALRGCLRDGKIRAELVLSDGSYSGRIVAGIDYEPGENGVLDPFFVPVASAHSRGILFGDAAGDCLAVWTPDGRRVDDVCHDSLELVPIGAEVVRELREAAEQMGSRGIRLDEPANLPAFERLFIDRDRVLYLAPADGDGRRKRLVEIAVDGRPSVVPLPSADRVFVSDGRALLAWDEIEGTRIEIYDLPARRND